MRRSNPLHYAVLAAAAMSMVNTTPLPEVVKVKKQRDAERLSKAEKKRERKNRQRMNRSSVKQIIVDDPEPTGISRECYEGMGFGPSVSGTGFLKK